MVEDEIAIVGTGCRFPGAENLEEFWRVLVNGENHVKDIPDSRWNTSAFYDEDKSASGKIYVKKAGLLDKLSDSSCKSQPIRMQMDKLNRIVCEKFGFERVTGERDIYTGVIMETVAIVIKRAQNHDKWDNKLFGISDVEASRMDPQQRYVLECVHMALEDGGFTRKQISGSKTGVIIGCMNDDYKSVANSDLSDIGSYNATGTAASVISARVSYVYNLHGTCLTLDTACSSALIAIHLAAQAIKTGDCDMVICGGVNSILTPDTFKALCEARMMSTIGQCQSFCDTADGYARGEGCGIVILKRLTSAIKDGNKVWAIIKAGSNQDGSTTNPMTAPSGDQQLELLDQVYASCSFSPCDIQYIEAHGTGTARGDPTEVNALGKFFSSFRKRADVPLLLGSVKSNIGHTESAAGTAGLLKILLMMKNGLFVPSIHVRPDKSNLNPDIKLSEFGLEISSHVKEWPCNINGERHACLNSFGFGGSNVHIIITQRKTTLSKIKEITGESSFIPICISGVDKESLKLNLLQFHDDLSDCKSQLSHISHTSFRHRDIFPYRTIIFGKAKLDIQKEIKNKLQHIDETYPHKKHRKVFVYCGVGTTWTGMCREFMQLNGVFRKTVDKIDVYLEPLTGWKIGGKFVANTSYDDPFLNHIAIFCCQVGLTEVWKSLGIVPDIVIGQSVGEVAAAYAAKSLTLEEAVNVIFHRSYVLSRQVEGSMAVVGNLNIKEVANMCSKYGCNVCIAVYSSPMACTVSGTTLELNRLINDIRDGFDGKDIFIRQLKVKCAYHSPLLDCCLGEIKARIDQYFVNKRKESEACCDTVPMLSTVTGKYVGQREMKSGDYWARNIREPVMFMQSLKQSFDEQRFNTYIEIGPRPVLRTHLPNIIKNDRKARAILSMKQNMELHCLFGSLSELFELGIDINNSALDISRVYELTAIPKYRFNRNGGLYIPNDLKDYLAGYFKENSDDHMFIQVSKYRDGMKFAICIDENSTPFVYDHSLFDDIIVPGATYVEAGFHIGKTLLQKPIDQLSVAFNFTKTFTPEYGRQHKINIQLKSKESDYLHFDVLGDDNLLAVGKVSDRKIPKRLSFDIDYLKGLCPLHMSRTECYSALERFKFRYGESLRLIQRAWISNSRSKCLTEICLPESTYKSASRTNFHPAVIDSIFQTFGVLASRPSAETFSLPKGVKNVVLNKCIEKVMFGYVEELKTNGNSTFYNAVLLSEAGTVLAEIDNFYTKTLSVNSRQVDKSYEYTLNWTEVLDFSENHSLDGNILLYTNDNYRDWIYELKEAINITCLNEIECILTEGNIFENTVLIYHACEKAHCNVIGEGTGMLNSVIKRFTEVQRLLATIEEFKTKPTVVFITETTQLCPGRKSVNYVGSELWGMLRSAAHEGFYRNILVVDIDPTMLDVTVLVRLILNKGYKDREFAISGSKLYRAIVKPEQKFNKYKRPVSICSFDKYALYSSKMEEISEPYLMLTGDEFSENDEELVVLQSFSMHDKTQYLPTVGKQDNSDFVLQGQTDEWQIVILEGRGYLQKTGADVLFLHPVNATTVVKIPEDNLINIADCPGYTSGILMLSNILVHIESEVNDHTTVMVITESEEVDIGQELLLKLLDKKRCNTHFCPLKLLEKYTEISHVQSLVIATPILKKQLENIIISLPTLRNIISLNLYIQDDLHMLIKHNFPYLNLKMLSKIEMFSANEIKKSMSRIKDCVHSLGYKASNSKTNEFLVKLPMNELRVQNGIDNGSLKCFCDSDNMFRSNACYIVVGGLTGLGWELLQLMAEMGAGALITLSRRKPSDAKQKEIEELKRKHACKIIPMQADISESQSVSRVFTDIQVKLPNYPIRGIFHGAGVISDSVLKNLDEKKIIDVLRPKILGACNLHVASLDIAIDYFVMHSSIVSVIGNPAQCNYAAANSFLDSLSLYRKTKGLPAQSINWGALYMGMAVENDIIKSKLQNNGFNYLDREKVRDSFLKALINDTTNVIYADIDWEKLLSVSTFSVQISKYTELQNSRTIVSKASKVKKIDLDNLSKLSMREKTEAVKNALKGIIHEVLVVEDDALTDQTAFTDIGIDSMAAMSLANAIEEMFKYRISILNLLSEATTLSKVVESVLKNIALPSETNNKDMDENIYDNPDFRDLFMSEYITFMQMDLQTTYFHNRDDPYLLNVIDLEMFKMKFHLDEWKKILQQVLKLHPGLRKKYRFTSKTDVSVETISEDALGIDIACVSIQSLENSRLPDVRLMYNPDINNSLPIFFQVAEDENSTILRIIAHTFVIDMKGISLFCKDMEKTLTAFISKQKDPPVMNSTVDVAETVKKSIFPKLKELNRFWDTYMNFDIKPITLGNNLQVVDVNFCCLSHLQIETNTVLAIKKYVAKVGISLYEFFMSLYHLYLFMGSKSSIVPVGTAADMRFHIPELSSVITRCANFIPVIAHINATNTMIDYIKSNSEQILTTTENGAFPSSLIVEKISSADARKNIFRHFLAMNDLTAINKLEKDKDRPRAAIKRVWHVRPDRETFVYVSYDLRKSWIKLETGHNSRICGKFGEKFPEKLMWLAYEAIHNGHKTIEQLQTEMTNTLVKNKLIVCEKNETKETAPTIYQNLKKWESNSVYRGLSEHHSVKNNDFKDKHPTTHDPRNGPSISNIITKNEKNKRNKPTEDKTSHEKRDVVFTGIFEKQTSRGWDHKVLVTLSLVDGHSVVLEWGNKRHRKIRSIVFAVGKNPDVVTKAINGRPSLVISQNGRRLILKTPYQQLVTQYMDNFARLMRSMQQTKTEESRLKQRFPVKIKGKGDNIDILTQNVK